MHSPGLRQKHTPIRRNGGRAVQQIVEDGIAGAARMHALHRLRQLHLIAHQDDVARSHAHRDQIRHTHLTSLVDEEIVQLLSEDGVGK
ncbi:hypothetical protein D3C71_1231330 [compost metagenome]